MRFLFFGVATAITIAILQLLVAVKYPYLSAGILGIGTYLVFQFGFLGGATAMADYLKEENDTQAS